MHVLLHSTFLFICSSQGSSKKQPNCLESTVQSGGQLRKLPNQKSRFVLFLTDFSIKHMAQRPHPIFFFLFNNFKLLLKIFRKGLHFSLLNPTILSIYMNQKNNTAEPSGLLLPKSSSIPALRQARRSQQNLGPLTCGCSNSAVLVTDSALPQLSAILF